MKKTLFAIIFTLTFLLPAKNVFATLDQHIGTYYDTINASYGDPDIVLGGSAQSTISYSTNNAKVVQVSKVGIVKVIGVGTAEITLRAEGTREYKAAKKVVPVKIKKATPEVRAYGSSIIGNCETRSVS